jgi:CRISPR-associated endonuclease/helicase Cas3
MNRLSYLWAKTSCNLNEQYNPLILHMLDVAACADIILEREPECTCKRMAAMLGLNWDDAKPWLLTIIACHDLGKACPGFQLKWAKSIDLLCQGGFHIPKGYKTDVNHAFVSQFALEDLLIDEKWPVELAELCAEAVGSHHGTRATPTKIETISGDRYRVDGRNWQPVWKDIFKVIKATLSVHLPPDKASLTGTEFMLLAGLASFADWIGSNEEWFPYGNPTDCDDLKKWLTNSKKNAEIALNAIGWKHRTSLITSHISFNEAFPQCSPPRPLQEAVARAVTEASSPCVLLIEAPMGEGKTEAAFYAHLELQHRFSHRGLYIAMPTKATGNAMFSRTLDFLKAYSGNRILDLQLLHGATQLNDTFERVRLGQIHSDEGDGAILAGSWFTFKKRALLSEYGVGTIDQALLTILPVRHYFVRLWGLANRVVVFDEIHAYDAYTGTLLFHLIRWLRALGSTVILLSATLPPEFRRRLAAALGNNLPVNENVYPRLTMFTENNDNPKQIHFETDHTRKRELVIVPLEPAIDTLYTCLIEKLPCRGYAGVIVNTVQRAQDLYRQFGKGEDILVDGVIVGKSLEDGTEIHLFHARFPAQERQRREDTILSLYGKNEKNGKLAERKGKHILIATQVAEQSLDLDFDLLITDLAPIDLILQRAGRLWRHNRDKLQRPIRDPLLCIAGLVGEIPGSFGEPLWWNKVYEREDILLRTWQVLSKRTKIALPNEIELLVNDVYEGLSMPTEDDVVKRIEKTEIESLGVLCAQRTMAHQAIIGLPTDASWKDTARFCLYDDDEPGVHHTLKAQTRLGEDSVVAIPILPQDLYCSSEQPDYATSKKWALRAVSLARKGVVKKLRSKGIPEAWKKDSLLRNYYPMVLDENGIWNEDNTVKLDKEYGIVYTPKEVK